MAKAEKDKQDLTIFSILLLTSRLVPFSFFADDRNDDASKQRDHRTPLYMQPEIQERLNTYLELIKSYCGSGTYFVRKISAQAMLPLLRFSEFIPEIVRTLTSLR